MARSMYRLFNALAVLLLVGSAGCRQDMHDQPKYKPLRQSSFFADGRTSRQSIEGTVARGQLDADPVLFEGRNEDGSFVDRIPVPVDAALLNRGRERYNIYCSPCHDQTGSGRGMIVQRGYKQPPTFHSERLRTLPPGYFYNVIHNGFGVMPAYGEQVPSPDRWAIVSYIQALQRSQHAALTDVPEAERQKLRGAQ